MNTNNHKILNLNQKITLRLLILFGLISIGNFFYWFTQPEFIENKFLFWMLIVPMVYESIRVIYIWYLYWDFSVPVKPQSSKKFTVDVFTTYFPGEPHEMVKESLLAIKRMKYPHITYLCDEANDPELIEFCKQHDVVHVTRNNRIDAKAGNINNALKQASGDICLVLDPDHIPKENFLDEIVPYFEDDNIGFVQTVQGYYNIKESNVAQGAAEQTFHFYGPLMMTMNSYGTVNAIGANCVFRRKALDSIGGHAAGLSEDMHTAMQLHAKGWKSVYVPKTYTKGLVPSTLTAYYKQQLKWSRGTLDLLLYTYPKLFNRFTWRQKIHYGFLPLYYLSGIFTLLSFLIPIVALFTATIPWKGNIINFFLMVLPVFISMAGVRYYVQGWLADKSERGMHIQGGLLLAGTWWIYIIGTVYTLIRKKVPYLPTPKNGNDKTNWKLLIPNLLLGVISIVAVAYGISIDFTPFTLLMSGFAFINVFLMFYTIYLAYEKQKPVSFSFNYEIRTSKTIADLQNLFFRIWSRTALPLTILIIACLIGIYYQTEYVKWLGVKPEKQNKNSLTYIGIFAPQDHSGISSLNEINKIIANNEQNFDIVSLYLAWDNNPSASFPQAFIDSIYIQQSIPMITWEPWTNMYQDDNHVNDNHVFDLINEGYFDSYISIFAGKLRLLQKPVYLRFAHEFDNPFYPWYVNEKSGIEKFKKAWVHTYEIFKNQGAFNVIWVWNPWKSSNVASFYPGKDYVDWFGVNVLNYGALNEDATWHSFKELYQPFHDEFQNLPSTPVMISEFSTLRWEPNQDEWYDDAFNSIENEYNEIKSLIYFHSNRDNNLSAELMVQARLDWTIPDKNIILKNFYRQNMPDYLFKELPEVNIDAFPIEKRNTKHITNLKGINIKTGRNWKQDYQVLNRKKLMTDFKRIRDLGINTVNIEGNSVYEYNLLNVSKIQNLNISYAFWVPEDIDFVAETKNAEKLKKEILRKVNSRKNTENIVAWRFQNDVQYNQKDYFLKPRLLYQNNAYILWLQDIVSEIKEVDDRPVIVDVEVNPLSIYHAKLLLSNIPDIDYIGLVVKEDAHLENFVNFLNRNNIDYIFSEVDSELAVNSDFLSTGSSFMIASWQDQHENNKITFDGIIDRKGRPRSSYYKLKHALHEQEIEKEIPDVRILKPSGLIYEGSNYKYIAMVYVENEGWKYSWQTKDLSFEWSLVKCDVYGNALAVKDIAQGDMVNLTIPRDYKYFKLMLTVGNGKSFESLLSSLHNPLFTADANLN